MNLAGLVPASESRPDPAQRQSVLNAGLKGSRGPVAGSVAAYVAADVVGTGLVRFDGKVLNSKGLPRWSRRGLRTRRAPG